MYTQAEVRKVQQRLLEMAKAIKEILEKAGKKVGLIGTVAVYINGDKIEDSERKKREWSI